tara:strand:- start:331 stop:507 length:177 start_codon:yes stop_codon:yes gene_type:complete
MEEVEARGLLANQEQERQLVAVRVVDIQEPEALVNYQITLLATLLETMEQAVAVALAV